MRGQLSVALATLNSNNPSCEIVISLLILAMSLGLTVILLLLPTFLTDVCDPCINILRKEMKENNSLDN